VPINNLTEEGFGMLTGSAASPSFSFGNALQFDGVNDFVNYSAVYSGSESRTVEAWIRVTSADLSGTRYLFGQSGTAAANHFHLDIRSGVLTFTAAGGAFTFSTSKTFLADTNYHVAVTYDGTTVVVYVDGLNVGSQNYSLNTDGTLFRLGVRIDINLVYAGLINEFRMWNVARTQQEIQDNKEVNVIGQTGLLVYSRMNETGTDTTATDSSGNGNNGTLNNFPVSGMWVAY